MAQRASLRLFPSTDDGDRAEELGKFIGALTDSDGAELARELKLAIEEGKAQSFVDKVLQHQELVVAEAPEEGVCGVATIVEARATNGATAVRRTLRVMQLSALRRLISYSQRRKAFM